MRIIRGVVTFDVNRSKGFFHGCCIEFETDETMFFVVTAATAATAAMVITASV